ncbi:MAG: DUF3987 domain-containing protein [Prevotella sp.]
MIDIKHNLEMANALEAKKPQKTTTEKPAEQVALSNPSALEADINRVASELIARNLDITNAYSDWLRLGFALADGLGEGGRQLFHDLSRQCSKYEEKECDKQYSNCLNARGSGVTVKTFFQMAKDAGIELCASRANMPSGIKNGKDGNNDDLTGSDQFMPNGRMAEMAENGTENPNTVDCEQTFSDKIIREDLPAVLLPIYDSQPDFVGKDKMLLGSITTFSGVMPQSIYGIYDGRKVFAPLYLIIYGPFASSKGDLEAAKRLIAPIKREMKIDYEEKLKAYETAKAEWDNMPKKERGPEPKEPVPTSPFVPANSSASAVYRALDANGDWGLIFETEADTLTNMLSKSEYGDYTDLLRKAFHHETLSMLRVADKINIEIEQPRLAVMLTCTGSQLALLLPPGNVSNGLASRFLFYALPEAKVEFRDVFAKSDEPVEDIFKRIGYDFMPLYHELQERERNPLQFSLTKEQQKRFLTHFDAVVKEQFSMLGNGIQGFIFRIALECFRYAMVLSLLRCLSDWDKKDTIFLEMQRSILCDDRDFNTAMTIVECLVSHTARVYSVLASEDKDPFRNCAEKPNAQMAQFYKSLPDGREFKTGEALEIGKTLGIPERTANRMLGSLASKYQVLKRIRQGLYSKMIPKEQ